MTSQQLRTSFLDYFAGQDHRILPSAPLKPSDPTTLFTSAGMQPFVPWFRGLVPPAAPRVATCQKCFRADDVEEVGRTPRHSTFFEMLGNFSFGDYFKEGSIEFAWEYVTTVLGISKSRIWITVNSDDDETPEIWKRIAGIAEARIVADPLNWWGPVGNSGPCGPNTEIIIDLGEQLGCGKPSCNPTCDCPRFTELWNLVFQMYNKLEDGKLELLPNPGIDTGMGFERMVALMQGAPTIFETDVFAPIVSAAIARARQSNPKLPENLTPEQTTAVRIISDHTRALAFLLADGFTPANEGAGYVLRRVLRRAYRYGRSLGIEEPFIHTLTPAVLSTMGPAYPELRGAGERIKTCLLREEQQFEETLERSLGPLMTAIERAQAAGATALPGEEVFRLHDTYGLPKDMAADLAAEHGLTLDEEGFARAMEAQRQRARAHAGEDFAFAVKSGYQNFVGKTEFLGYAGCGAEGTVIGIVMEGESRERLIAGEEGEVFLDQTPFYAEGGGQVGDRGELVGRAFPCPPAVVHDAPRGGRRQAPAQQDNAAPTAECKLVAKVLDTHRPVEGAHAHTVKVIEGELRVGQQVEARVDQDRRLAIARAHTATHLLHHVLRQVLGEHAVQSGSLVDADHLRFDFAHFSALTEEERRQLEDRVVELALRDEPLDTEEMRLEDARKTGATALFGEKYGEFVRVVRIGGFSTELCGGTHLAHAGAIGGFAILHESSIGAGLRRIEAVTGREAQALAVYQRDLIAEAAGALKCRPEEIIGRIGELQGELKHAQRQLEEIEQQKITAIVQARISQAWSDWAIDVNGIKLAILPPFENAGSESLRKTADSLLSHLGSGIVVLGSKYQGAVLFVATVSPDLVKAGYHAGNLIREIAKVAGGGGGGRPDFAQAGGKLPEKLEEALAKAKELVAEQKG